MIIAFYRVNNSKEYGRNEFASIYDNKKLILDMLRKLDDDEWRAYDTTRFAGNGDPNMLDLQEDYNDEMLDGGWWCIVIPD